MEIIFKDSANPRPVYDYDVKQEWEKHVRYECPAKLLPAELRAIERAARETFIALDCRDVARVDLRLRPTGEVYVIEINPLPGLTPDYSDLVLISTGAGISYRSLISEILAGGLKRLREKRRDAQAAPGASPDGKRVLESVPAAPAPSSAAAGGRPVGVTSAGSGASPGKNGDGGEALT
jgi:D-alanine-D-alanine ligase